MNIYKKILREYDKKQTRNKLNLEKRKEQIYKKFPRIKEIDTKIADSAISLMKKSLSESENIDELINKQDDLVLDLKKEKIEILNSHGYDKDFLELQYGCKKCKDTGFINGSKCKCFKQKVINEAYNKSNLGAILEKENFDTFNYKFYSDKKSKDNKSPREIIKKAFNKSLDFCTNFDLEFDNLLFYGHAGTGKTFLCNCIAKDLLDRGKSVIYLTAFDLFKKITDYKFNNSSLEDDPLDTILACDLLIIDDLGSEFSNSLTNPELFNCINSRLLNNKSVVISTNLNPNQLKEKYSDRIISRIIGNYSIIEIIGEDIRINKKLANKS